MLYGAFQVRNSSINDSPLGLVRTCFSNTTDQFFYPFL
uniref:Uncharacterized protein n=1 Tax=Manihot esculenta TaxID=3983 RepID=A0A2C9UHR7_MANES